MRTAAIPNIRPLTVVLAVGACALALAACGGSGSDPSGSSGSQAAKRAGGLAFSECMRSHGVPDFPDPSTSNGGGVQISASARAGSGQSLSVNGVPVNAPAFQSAMNACRKDLPKGGAPPASVAQLRTAALAMARSMRSHGVPNFPDPKIGTGPGGAGVGVQIGGPGSGIDPSSPAFQTAARICKPLFARQTGHGGGGAAGP